MPDDAPVQISIRMPKSMVKEADDIADKRYAKLGFQRQDRVGVMREAMRAGFRLIRAALKKGDYRPLE